MEWFRKMVFPVRKVWYNVSKRFGVRKTGELPSHYMFFLFVMSYDLYAILFVNILCFSLLFVRDEMKMRIEIIHWK